MAVTTGMHSTAPRPNGAGLGGTNRDGVSVIGSRGYVAEVNYAV